MDHRLIVERGLYSGPMGAGIPAWATTRTAKPTRNRMCREPELRRLDDAPEFSAEYSDDLARKHLQDAVAALRRRENSLGHESASRTRPRST